MWEEAEQQRRLNEARGRCGRCVTISILESRYEQARERARPQQTEIGKASGESLLESPAKTDFFEVAKQVDRGS